MTDTLWHGNDDPPADGDYIEYIHEGKSYFGVYYRDETNGGIIMGHIVEPDGKFYKHSFYNHMLRKVSQWRLA